MDIVVSFFTTLLVELYKVSGNLGLAIILFTVLIRSVLWPLTLPSLKAQKKIKALQPELKELKKKHGSDKKAFQQAQMDLYKKYNINPLSGCLPQLVQIGLLIVLYQALLKFLKQTVVNGVTIHAGFAWLDLSKPDPWFVLPILAAVTQLILSMMIMPATETPDVVPNVQKNKKTAVANKKEEDVAEMAQTMQSQMMFMMPVVIGFSALRFPSGLALYWTITTVFSIVQQYVVSGPGGLTVYPKRAWVWLSARFAK